MQALSDQFNCDKQKVEQVVKSYEELETFATLYQVSLSPHDTSELQKPLLLSISSETRQTSVGYVESSVDYVESSVDYVESSVDIMPADLAAIQEEELKKLQRDVELLEEECVRVEDKLKQKTMALTEAIDSS